LKFIANNPQAALNENIEIESINFLEMLHDDEKKKKKKKDNSLETAILEQAIGKLSQLLALGFGEAGSTIIA
jgi:hypothetical protein